jgi:hypothetical protein
MLDLFIMSKDIYIARYEGGVSWKLLKRTFSRSI